MGKGDVFDPFKDLKRIDKLKVEIATKAKEVLETLAVRFGVPNKEKQDIVEALESEALDFKAMSDTDKLAWIHATVLDAVELAIGPEENRDFIEAFSREFRDKLFNLE